METVVQVLDEIDEVVGLLWLGARANGRRIALNAALFALAVVAMLLPA